MIRLVVIALLLLPIVPAMALDNLTWNLLGVQENGSSYTHAVSNDGRYIVFDSAATNLGGTDTNGSIRDIYLYDRNNASLELISVDNNGQRGSGHSRQPRISGDGRYVVFESFSALAPGGTNGLSQIYLRDRQAHTTRLVSANISGIAGNGPSYHPRISADGKLVVFDSMASNLGAGDSNGYSDVFIKHLDSGQLERVSVAYGGGQANNGSFEAEMSSDGRYVVFVSMASNIVSPAVATQRHVYLRDRLTGAVRLVSVSNGGVPANGACFLPDVDDAGQHVVFYSLATSLTPGLNGTTLQVFMHDMNSATTELISHNAANAGGNDHSFTASISGDGRFVAFSSFANDLVSGDNNAKSDVYLKDLASGEMKIVSLGINGVPANDSILGVPSIDAHGGVIAFTSYASNLVAQDNNGYADIFVLLQNLNSPPLAVAGPSQVLECRGVSTPVTLDGRASSDADGDTLSYLWSGGFGQAEGAVVTVPMALGEHSASLTVGDGKGGVDIASTTIRIRDSVAPSLELPARITLEAESRDGTAYELTPVANDLCGTVGIAIAPSYSSYPLGDNTITVTATDASGNSSRAETVVSVQDTIPPQLQVPPDLLREAQARETAVDIGTATATDIFDVNLSNNAPAAFPLGTTVVSWRAEDSNGNVSEAGQSVTIEDTTPPVFLSLPADIDAEATAVLSPLSLTPPEASDIFALSISSDAPAAFPLGNTVVTWQARDSSGNLASASQTVRVHDTTPPSVVAPPDIVTEAKDRTTVVALGSPVAKDIFPLTIRNNAPSAFPLGTSVVNWQVSDSSGNTAMDTQLVTVRDTTAPILSVPPDLVIEALGPLTPVSLAAASASDIFDVSLSNNAPVAFPLGTTVVTWRAEDSSGNLSRADQRVTLVDTTAPDMHFEPLQDSLWPPNHRFREVARLSGVHDRVDSAPVVDIDVQVVDSPLGRTHRSREWQPYQALEHGRNDDRGRAAGDREAGHEPDLGSLRRGQHGGHRHHRERVDWKVVERDGVWHIYVRARKPDFHGERSYEISATVSDASGNRSQAQAQVIVAHSKRQRR